MTAAFVCALGCDRRPATVPPLSPATLLSGASAIPYPVDLYAQRIEGDVMLYLVVDSSGTVVRDSTRIITSSGKSGFDAAALQAAPTLRFTPARRGGVAVTAAIRLPIRFALPDSLKHARTRP